MPDTPTRPNALWIFGDQHRAQATGYGGDPNVHTPNLDRLAALGMVFDNAVGGCPLCCPYRGSLLTSRYPHHAVPAHQARLDPSIPTVANAFDEAGYHTAYFGKWHLDGFHESNGRAVMHTVPPERRGGFHTWLGYENNNNQWDTHLHGHTRDHRDAPPQEVARYRLPGYETDALTDLLIDYLKRRAAGRRDASDTDGSIEPFFGVMSAQPPHDPYVAPERFMQRHTPGSIELRPNVPAIPRVETQARRGLAGYYAQIENLDWNVGRILDTLFDTGLIDTTHLIFFSDHGDMHGSHGQFLKTNPYNESLRVPCILSGGARGRDGVRGGRTDVPLNHVDLAPTTLGLCGIDPPDGMRGTDLSGHRVPGRPRNRPPSAYLQLVVPTGHSHSTDRPWRGVITADGWKYVCLEGQPWLMFDGRDDPYEQANLAHNPAYHKDRSRLHEMLREWIEQTEDTFVLPEL